MLGILKLEFELKFQLEATLVTAPKTKKRSKLETK